MMKPIPWKEQFSVGVKEIDRQHQGLLDIINKIIDSIEKENAWESTKPIIDSLIHYAYNHFATEEQYMIKVHYPELSEHIQLHLNFIKRVFELSLKVSQNGPEIQQELLKFVAGWYYEHVLGIDRKYMPYLAEKGIT